MKPPSRIARMAGDSKEAVERADVLRMAEQHTSHARWVNYDCVSASKRPGGTAFIEFHTRTSDMLITLLAQRDAAARAGFERAATTLRAEAVRLSNLRGSMGSESVWISRAAGFNEAAGFLELAPAAIDEGTQR